MHRDFDTFGVTGAVKEKDGKVRMVSFGIRFVRSGDEGLKKNAWTYNGWRVRGMIREANVFK